jgi:glycosyltransferase involved in cell wall biosynthesis
MPVRAAFIMEQALGHVTHYYNLRDAVAEQEEVAPTWLPIPFDVQGPARLIPVLRSNWSVRASWRARRALQAVLASHAHDVLLFHTQVTALFSPALMARIPTIVSLDATPINYDSVGPYYGHRAAGNGFLDRQKYRLNRRVFQGAAAMVAWSEWAKRSLVDDYGADPLHVRVIAPGAAPSYFEIGERRAPRLGSRGAGDDREGRPVRILFVGGDFQRKGGPLLLECMRYALADRCELHLVTKAAVPPQRNVFVYRDLGPNSPELTRLFAEADIFVLPSNAECLAVVLMEATAAGLPVITTDVGALREAVKPGESGIVLHPGDGRALLRALRALVDDAAFRARAGRAGHALAREKFDARRNNRALLDLVRDVSQSVPAATRRWQRMGMLETRPWQANY